MASRDQCAFCKNDLPRAEPLCPHCAQPSRFPNVLDATEDVEQIALEQRYQDAIRGALARGCEAQVREFERATANSKAVIARSVIEADRLASSDHQLYATYYQLVHGGVRIPIGEKWDKLRAVADVALFGEQNKQHIRFAALTLDGVGLDNYGECSLVVRDEMIAHRASVFEENSVKFMERHQIGLANVNDLPAGYRAPWRERAKLCTTKHAADIGKTSRPEVFPRVLLKPGATSDDDVFVEVHIWGPMTVRTFERVIVRRKNSRPNMRILKALAERLAKYGVPLQVERWKR